MKREEISITEGACVIDAACLRFVASGMSRSVEQGVERQVRHHDSQKYHATFPTLFPMDTQARYKEAGKLGLKQN